MAQIMSYGKVGQSGKVEPPFFSTSLQTNHKRLTVFCHLTRALMGSGELHVLMGGGGVAQRPPSVSSKVRVVEDKFKRRWKDLFELYRIRLC